MASLNIVTLLVLLTCLVRPSVQANNCSLGAFADFGLKCLNQYNYNGTVNLTEIGMLIGFDIVHLLGLEGGGPVPEEICKTNCSDAGCTVGCTAYSAYRVKYHENFWGLFEAGSITGRDLLDVGSKYLPEAAYMVGAAYDKWLAQPNSRSLGVYAKYIGDTTGLKDLWKSKLTYYCNNVGPQLSSCVVQGVTNKCGADAAAVFEPYFNLFHTRYCDANRNVKSNVLTNMQDHFPNMFSEVRCILDPDNTTHFDLDWKKFEKLGALFHLRLDLPACNVDATFAKLAANAVKWFNQHYPSIDDVMQLNLTPFLAETDELVDTMISYLKRFMTCLMSQIEPLIPNICEDLNALELYDKYTDLLKIVLPAPQLTLAADEMRGIFGNTMVLPSLVRKTVVITPTFHVFVDGAYKRSCNRSEWNDWSKLLLQTNDFTIRDAPYYFWFDELSASYQSNLAYVSVGGSMGSYDPGFSDFPRYQRYSADKWEREVAGFEREVKYDCYNESDATSTCWFTDAGTGIQVKLITYIMENNGERHFEQFTVLRGPAMLINNAYGLLSPDYECPMTYETAAANFDYSGATAYTGCENLCNGVSGEYYRFCMFDCVENTKNTQHQQDYVQRLKDAIRISGELETDDQMMTNLWANLRPQKDDTHPCSPVGWLTNVGEYCIRYDIHVGRLLPNLMNGTDNLEKIFKDIGTIEPYAMYAISSFVQRYSTYNPLALASDAEFTMAAGVQSAFDQHCSIIPPIIDCMANRMDQSFCSQNPDKNYRTQLLTPVKDRYCSYSGSTGSVKSDVINALTNDFNGISSIVKCVVRTNNTNFRFADEILHNIWNDLIDRCELEQIMAFALSLMENAGRTQVMDIVGKIKGVLMPPARCIVRRLNTFCTDPQMNDWLRDYLAHFNRVTANIFNFQESDFIRNLPNPASTTRVSLWVVGDPHIRKLDATEFTTCDSIGLTTFVRNDNIKFWGYNVKACPECSATYLANFTIDIYHPTNGSLMATYFTEGENPVTSFTTGEVEIQTGAAASFIEYDSNTKTVRITDANSGILIAARPWKKVQNVVVRLSKSMAESSSGLLITGCDFTATDIESTIARKKRATSSECQIACAGSPSNLLNSCVYDCVQMDDTGVSAAHASVEEVESEVESKDTEVLDFIPAEYIQPEETVDGNAASALQVSFISVFSIIVMGYLIQ